MHDDFRSEADACDGSYAVPGLVVALRRAACHERPLHDDGLEQRVLRAVGAEPAVGRWSRCRRVIACIGLAVATAASVMLGWSPGLLGRRPSLPGVALSQSAEGSAPPLVEAVAFEELPLPDELGAQLLAKTAAVAAEAVGLPEWNDLVAGGSFDAEGDTTP